MQIGVLGLQGDVAEHVAILRKIVNKNGVKLVKYAHEIDELDGLIIPGGESTTLSDLIVKYGIDKAIAKKLDLPIFGTCAGTILLAKELVDQTDQYVLKMMDIKVERNAYGRQRESFEVNLDIPVLGKKPFRAVFIRGPTIVSCGKEIEVLAKYEGKPVLARQGNKLAATFHPELTDDLRIQRYFIEMVKENGELTHSSGKAE
ncbi:MAG: pyridoxal 5'-phosphate synthase glutaminase subunit PdxT [Candidatus Hydrothermarchaeales archaeon]